VTDEVRPEVVSQLAQVRLLMPERDPRDLFPDVTEGELLLAQHMAENVARTAGELFAEAGVVRRPRGVLDLTPRELYALAFVYSQLVPVPPWHQGKRLGDLLKVIGDRERGNVLWLLDWAGFPLPAGWEVPDHLDLGSGDDEA